MSWLVDRGIFIFIVGIILLIGAALKNKWMSVGLIVLLAVGLRIRKWRENANVVDK